MSNFNGVKHGKIRELLDPKYVDLVEKLEDCFYGDKDPKTGKRSRTNCWLDGSSRPFTLGARTFDVRPTVEQSRNLFNKIHGAIWSKYEVEFDELNAEQPEPETIDDTLSADDVAMSKKLGHLARADRSPILDENGEKQICRIDNKHYDETDEQGNVVQSRKAKAEAKLADYKINPEIPTISLERWEQISGVKTRAK